MSNAVDRLVAAGLEAMLKHALGLDEVGVQCARLLRPRLDVLNRPLEKRAGEQVAAVVALDLVDRHGHVRVLVEAPLRRRSPSIQPSPSSRDVLVPHEPSKQPGDVSLA